MNFFINKTLAAAMLALAMPVFAEDFDSRFEVPESPPDPKPDTNVTIIINPDTPDTSDPDPEPPKEYRPSF